MEDNLKNIVIIGGGPGGYEAAIEGAKIGHKITLIEAHRIGGTCLHYGCIPTKTLQHEAKVYRDINNLSELDAISINGLKLDYSKLKERKIKVTETLEKGIMKSLKSLKVDVIKGFGKLTKDGVTVETESGDVVLKPDAIILALGSKPSLLNIPGINTKGVITSKELLDMDTLPKSLTIVGAGVIGMEFAFIYSALGVEVTIIEYLDRILPQVDLGISKRLKAIAKKQGIDILLKSQVTSIETSNEAVNVNYISKGDHKHIMSTSSEKVLISTGRKANLDERCFTGLDIEIKNGHLVVSDQFETNLDNVFAIGDMIDQGMLAHVAADQGKWLMEYLAYKDTESYEGLIPAAVFTMPEIATVGFTEEQLKELDVDYKVYKNLYGAVGKAHAINATEGFIKILVDSDDIVIGVHILGEDASNLIQEGVIAIKKRMTINELQKIIHVHPTLSEIYL